mmetsp:Transcript_20367/g.58197  ORF Transcript_20367/g.58197 Transcript_20367/m.58197 type:complete len:223 (-) Transcript_20367:101-769(-)
MFKGNWGTRSSKSVTDTVRSTAPMFIKAKRSKMMSAMERTSWMSVASVPWTTPERSSANGGVVKTLVSPPSIGKARTRARRFLSPFFFGLYRDLENRTRKASNRIMKTASRATMYAPMTQTMAPPTKKPKQTMSTRLAKVTKIFSPGCRRMSKRTSDAKSVLPSIQRCNGPQTAFQKRNAQLLSFRGRGSVPRAKPTTVKRTPSHGMTVIIRIMTNSTPTMG